MTIAICTGCRRDFIDETDLCTACTEEFASLCDCVVFVDCGCAQVAASQETHTSQGGAA